MNRLVFIFLILMPFFVGAQKIRVGVFYGKEIKSLTIRSINGNCQVHTAKGFLTDLNEGSIITLNINSAKKIHISLDGKFLGVSDSLFLHQLEFADYLSFLSPDSRFKKRKYQGDFNISQSKGALVIINEILIDDYLEGVLASEAGTRLETEYYKVQAIISRTYALNNSNKHINEGFNLCDGVHCQAYLGRYEGESNAILNGIDSTKGKILLDSNNNRFPVFFSANCGGQSSETDQIWSANIAAYLSRVDTFCIHTRQANWEKYIPKKDVVSFLKEKYFVDVNSPMIAHEIINFKQDNRKTFFIHPYYGIPLRDIRKHFGLKSTYFDTEQVGDKILFKGKGFGHGVGLCQEGAMNMIKKNFSYEQVLKYYFSGTKISDYRIDTIYK